MKKIFTITFSVIISLNTFSQQGFFLEDSWQAKNSTTPVFTEVSKTTSAPSVNVTVDFNSEITKVSPYLFGHCVSQFYGNYYTVPHLLENIQNLNPNILRYAFRPERFTDNIFTFLPIPCAKQPMK